MEYITFPRLRNYISSNIYGKHINGISYLYSRTNYLLSDFSILPSVIKDLHNSYCMNIELINILLTTLVVP